VTLKVLLLVVALPHMVMAMIDHDGPNDHGPKYPDQNNRWTI
jgi:hypothetical protein